MGGRWQQAARATCGTFPRSPRLRLQAAAVSPAAVSSQQPETGQEMVDSLSASDGRAGRYLDNTPEHPYIPYDAPSVRGRAHITSRSRMDDTSRHGRPAASATSSASTPFPSSCSPPAPASCWPPGWAIAAMACPAASAERHPGMGASRSGQDDGRLGHAGSDRLPIPTPSTGEAADTLGQTHRENPPPAPPGPDRADGSANPPIFDRP